MPKFAYVATKQTTDGIEEDSGVIDSPTIDLAMMALLSRGCVVRELRTAKPEECEIERLKQIRERLDPRPTHIEQSHRTESKLPYVILILMVIGLLVMYLILGGRHG